MALLSIQAIVPVKIMAISDEERRFLKSLPTVYDLHKGAKVLMEGQNEGVVAKLVTKGFPAVLVENKGDFPIKLNYTSDEYYYVTNDDKYYLIPADAGNDPYFPDGIAVINPNNNFGVTISGDAEKFGEFMGKLRNKEIKGMLVILNYGKLKIELKPVK